MHLPQLPVVLLLATSALAQTSLNDLPPCAQQAGLSAISATGCQLEDVKCICSSIPFLQTLRSYIEKTCSSADQAAALTFGQNLCLTVDITIAATVTSTPAPTSNSNLAATTQADIVPVSTSTSYSAIMTTNGTAGPIMATTTVTATVTSTVKENMNGTCDGGASSTTMTTTTIGPAKPEKTYFGAAVRRYENWGLGAAVLGAGCVWVL